jgi:hypothetical protein
LVGALFALSCTVTVVAALVGTFFTVPESATVATVFSALVRTLFAVSSTVTVFAALVGTFFAFCSCTAGCGRPGFRTGHIPVKIVPA